MNLSYPRWFYYLKLNTPAGMVFFILCYAIVLALDHAETEGFALETKAKEQILASENEALDRLNQMKNNLMSTISHETRTPLAVVSGYTELIAMELRKKGVDVQTASDLDKISEEILRIAAIMEEMQNFAEKKELADSKAPVQLADILRQCAKLYEPILARGNVKLNLLFPDELPLVFANPGEMTQVVFNLLHNAKNHTQNGTITISALVIDEMINISISDTGSGIPPGLLPHVFEHGVSGNENHNGIGLFLCKEIIESHNGTIEIHSEAGTGTAVIFNLPIAGNEAENESKS
jgi:signal transduction histidine kinase